jgi:hypothetical protein
VCSREVGLRSEKGRGKWRGQEKPVGSCRLGVIFVSGPIVRTNGGSGRTPTRPHPSRLRGFGTLARVLY